MKTRHGSKLSVSKVESSMETYLQFFFDLFSKMGAIPYKVTQNPETKDRNISPNKSIPYCIWVFGVITGCAHLAKTILSLTWMGTEYWKSEEIVKLAFHCFFAVALTCMTSTQMVFVAHYHDILRLLNGTVTLCRKLETGKEQAVTIFFQIKNNLFSFSFFI